jgi:hypothetical protein
MLFKNRLLTFPILLSTGLFSACANSNDAVITRASQIDAALNEHHDVCRYNATGETLAKTLMQQSGGQNIVSNLPRMCPDLNAEVGDRRNGGTSRAVADASPSEADAGNRAGSNDTGGPADGGAGTGNGGGDGSSGGASSSGSTSGSSGESTSGSAESTGAGSDGSSGGGKVGGKGAGSKGGGSNANNGGGNGSEGDSPGRGKGANNDEG